MADTIGDRVYAIRLARGDGKRSPMPLRAFAELVREQGGKWVDPSTLSLIERDMQRASIDDIEAISAVDPEGRGRSWLAFGLDERQLKMDELRDNALKELGDARLKSISTLDPFIREGYYGLAQNMSLEEAREFALKRLNEWYSQFSDLVKDPALIDEERRSARRYHAATLMRIRNRRGVIDYLMESMEMYFLTTLAAYSRAEPELLDNVTLPTPRPEALVPLPNDEKGQPLPEGQPVVMDPVEIQMQEDEDRLAEYGIIRPHWMREFESRKLNLKEEKLYFIEALRLRGRFCLARFGEELPQVPSIVERLQQAFEAESARARSSSVLQALALKYMNLMISDVAAVALGKAPSEKPLPTARSIAKDPQHERSGEIRKAIALPLTDFWEIADRAERGDLFKRWDDEHLDAESSDADEPAAKPPFSDAPAESFTQAPTSKAKRAKRKRA